MRLNGVTVTAYYHPIAGLSDSEVFSDEVYCCAALVSRFYKEVFDTEVTGLYPGKTPLSDNELVLTDSPSAGDIYSTSNHWAIVKEVRGDEVVLFEQNWCWTDSGVTYAERGRAVDKDSGCYYTLKNKSVLKAIRCRQLAESRTASLSLKKLLRSFLGRCM